MNLDARMSLRRIILKSKVACFASLRISLRTSAQRTPPSAKSPAYDRDDGEQRRRRPRFCSTNQSACLRRTTNVSAVPKPSADVRRRRDHARPVAGLVRRRSNRCSRPERLRSLYSVRLAIQIQLSFAGLREKRSLLVLMLRPPLSNKAGGWFQAAIRRLRNWWAPAA